MLERFSKPRLDLIEWKPNPNYTVKILNETSDLYRYFDATLHFNFYIQCVQQTLEKTIPQAVDYFAKYDCLKTWLDNVFEMPDSMVAMLLCFLAQGNGTLSKRAREKDFNVLEPEEGLAITRSIEWYLRDVNFINHSTCTPAALNPSANSCSRSAKHCSNCLRVTHC